MILAVCVLIPRGFCGYLCPLGTLIDLFDWSIGRRVTRFRVADDGWWVHIKYYLLLGSMVAAFCGVLVTGFVAAIPVITRGLLFLGAPLQTGLMRGWHQVPPMNPGHLVSIVLFFGVLGLGLFKPRFWCKYVCPSGAVFSLGNLFRASERKVESSCINCNKCVEICPFDAIKPDFTTRTTDCTLCQTCAGVCPTHAIKFVERLEPGRAEGRERPAHPRDAARPAWVPGGGGRSPARTLFCSTRYAQFVRAPFCYLSLYRQGPDVRILLIPSLFVPGLGLTITLGHTFLRATPLASQPMLVYRVLSTPLLLARHCNRCQALRSGNMQACSTM